MAGSRKWYVYTDDAGVDYAINLDKSNTDAANGGLDNYPSTGGPKASVPRNIKVRYVEYADASRYRKIRCVCLTPTIYNGIVGGAVGTITDPIAGTGSLGLISAVGEKRRLPTPVDTGLTSP